MAGGVRSLLVRVPFTLYVYTVLVVNCFAIGAFARFIAIPFIPAWREAVPRVWARAILKAIARTQVEGLEHLPAGPCALFANHASFFDVVALQTLPLNLRFVAKRLFFRLPFLGPCLRWRGDIEMERTSGGARQDRRAMVKAVEAGMGAAALARWREATPPRVLVVFPESTRSRDGRLRPFRTRHLARHILRAGLPVVPVALHGTHRLWPPGRLLCTPARVRIILTPPVVTDDVSTALRRAHDQVAAALAERT